ncbi:vacuolar protein sorting-associated protein 72 homolog isoform X1 [Hydra vulgaris]|uniref:vacuolar protein sorting-associated protein 72 homolog isoform X1 n=1 Tax=Hydra vulgaris TaxID=6087 RepID=UPI0032EA2D60
MAAERSKRCNAGNRMSKLIEEQVEDEDDEFYNTMYGGFNEDDDDGVYEAPEDQEEDFVDSDFSLSEHDDENNESGEDETKKVRKRVKPKVFKQPEVVHVKKPSVKKVNVTATSQEKRERMRLSTLTKSEALCKRQKETVMRNPRQMLTQMRRLTQQELLAEAKITAEKNLASLAQFLKLEEEKKHIKISKVRYQGPIIRYQSVRMPLDETNNEYCSRNFLEFTDTNNFPREYFPNSRKKYPAKSVCIVTGQPAKYKDPLTGLPYANIEAFKYIRQQRKRIHDDLLTKLEAKKKKKIL